MPISSGLNSDTIRVGIVLPEDEIRELTISWLPELTLESDLPDLKNVSSITLSLMGDAIVVKNLANIVGQTSISLGCPDEVSGLSTKYGLDLVYFWVILLHL